MFDSDAVIADMRQIFGKPAPHAPATTPTPHAPATADPVPARTPRRASLFTRIDGIATIGFAAAVALMGIVAVPLLHQPAPPPPPAGPAPTPDLSTPAPAFKVDHEIAPPPAGSLPPSIVSAAVARSAVRHVHRPRRSHRPYRFARVHRPRVSHEAPHLTGEALRKALAEDAVLTRRLNQDALRKLPAS